MASFWKLTEDFFKDPFKSQFSSFFAVRPINFNWKTTLWNCGFWYFLQMIQGSQSANCKIYVFHGSLNYLTMVHILPKIFLSSLGFSEKGFNFVLVSTGSQQNTTKIILFYKSFRYFRSTGIRKKGLTVPFLKLLSMITHQKSFGN